MDRDTQKIQSSQPTLSNINVTPLVDVMLVLLIIFMICSPLINKGIKVDTPKTRNILNPSEVKGVLLTIGTTTSGQRQLRLGPKPVMLTELIAALKASKRIMAEKILYVDARDEVPYGFVAQVMAKVRKAGLAIGLVTYGDPERATAKKRGKG